MSTPSVDFGRSRTCPTDALTTYRAGRNFLMVLAFVGDSTMIRGFATAVSGGCGSLGRASGHSINPDVKRLQFRSRGARAEHPAGPRSCTKCKMIVFCV